MSNKSAGKIDVAAGGKTYTLQFSINALCELEDELGGNIVDIEKALGGTPGLNTMRTLFFVGLRQNHPDISKLEAGNIMDELGLERASQVVTTALLASFPKKGPGDPLAGSAPAKAAATG